MISTRDYINGLNRRQLIALGWRMVKPYLWIGVSITLSAGATADLDHVGWFIVDVTAATIALHNGILKSVGVVNYVMRQRQERSQ